MSSSCWFLGSSISASPQPKPLEDLAVRLHSFEHHYEAIAKPFEWRFTRADLQQLLKRIQSPGPPCYELAA